MLAYCIYCMAHICYLCAVLLHLSAMNPSEIALQRIKDAIAHCSAELDLSGLGIHTLPNDIAECGKDLSVLRLNNNQLQYLPHVFERLTQLRILHLQHNQIAHIPEQVGKCTNLLELRLDHNQISNVPRSFRQLTQLQYLDLSHNRLHLLPAYFQYYNRLKTLRVAANNLSRLPECILGMHQLQYLDLTQNHLSFIPPDIGQLTNLRSLSLANNQINHIAAEIGNLTQLRSLNLAGNLLASLPTTIAQLQQLGSCAADSPHTPYQDNRLDLSGNRFQIPEEVYHQSPAETIQYILDLQASRHLRPLHEAKLIFIGWGSVGKTSLINVLTSGTFRPEQQRTDGVDIKAWRIKRGKDRIKLNVWDFGGQEIMHATHKFFMSARSAYVLVVDSRAEDAYGELGVEYWLKLIRSYAGEVPIVVVLNKCDQHRLNIPRLELQAKYPHIVDFVETSCAASTGIDELRHAVEKAIAQLPHIDDLLPEQYFSIKNKLELLPDDYLSYEAYVEICRKVDPDFSETSSQSLMHLLHDLGIMLNYRDDHNAALHLQVLKPEWVTRGVYQIITAPLLAQRRGIISNSDIARILDAQQYPNNIVRSYIMQLMLRFELCFQMTEYQNQYFIPAVFPQDRPKNLPWDYKPDQLLRFQYHYDVMPSTIMSRFIVKIHHFIEDHCYWRNGVILVQDQARAFVRADTAERKIFIQVAGNGNKRDLLAHIRAMFDLIHTSLPDIKTLAYIPVDEDGKITLRYSEVIHFINSGFYERPVEGMANLVNLLALVGEYYTPPHSKQPIQPADNTLPTTHARPNNQRRTDLTDPLRAEPILLPAPERWYQKIWVWVVSVLAFLALLAQVGDSNFLHHIWEWVTSER